MAFRSIAVNQTPSGSLVVTKPTGTADGDILVAFALGDTNPQGIVLPAGFTAFTGTPLTSSADAQELAAGWKLAASEGASYTIGGNGQNVIGGVAAFSGRDASTPIHKSSVGSQNSAQATPWSMTTAAFGSSTTVICDMVYIAASDNTSGGNVTHTAPAGYTIPANGDITDSNFRNGMLAYKDGESTGATGAVTGTGALAGSSAGWDCICVALAVSGGGGGAAGHPAGRRLGGVLGAGRVVGASGVNLF